MTPDDIGNDLGSIPAEAYPAPVLEYDLSDGVPVVDSVGESFRSEFAAVDTAHLVDGLAEAGLTLFGTATNFEDRIRDGEPFEVHFEVDTGRATARRCATVVPRPGSSGGHIVFACTCNHAHDGGDGIGVDHVASVVTHDLRNPLEVAKTRLRAARDTGQSEHFDRVADAHDRMERIIGDVLTLARGEDTVDPSAEFDLTEIARDAWEAVDTDSATLTVDSPLPRAVVDPDRTSRVFENLFRNSVEHGTTSSRRETEESVEQRERVGGDHSVDRTESGPQVRIGAVDPDTNAGFYVADDGDGIARDKRDAVLNPGYTTDQHGTGLGLAIVDQIAEAHGWTVEVTSSKAGGARIEVTGL